MGEDLKAYVARKIDAANKIIEEATRAGAIFNPITSDGLENGIPMITITIKINESKLLEWRKIQSEGA